MPYALLLLKLLPRLLPRLLLLLLHTLFSRKLGKHRSPGQEEDINHTRSSAQTCMAKTTPD